MMTSYRSFCFIFILTTFFCSKSFSQTSHFALQEKNFISLYSRLIINSDSTDFYSDKFRNEFGNFINANPATLAYPFKELIDSIYCFIRTSGDGNFRVYSWDTWTGGTMHFFNEIYQWKDKRRVFTKVLKYEKGAAGGFCSKIYTVNIKNKNYYLTISNSIYSTKDAKQSISVFSIDKGKLADTVKLFKTKTERLNTIDVEFDFFSVVDRPERPLELITYDDKQKIIRIPVVIDKGVVTTRNILYRLKANYFEFIGIEKGKRK
jgi:hypothetical protein